MRVQIPAYTDRWMMGDRYGYVVKLTTKTFPGAMPDDLPATRWIAHVKLDKSGKILPFLLEDCMEI